MSDLKIREETMRDYQIRRGWRNQIDIVCGEWPIVFYKNTKWSVYRNNEVKKADWKRILSWIIAFSVIILVCLYLIFWFKWTWNKILDWKWDELINPALKYEELQNIMDNKSLNIQEEINNYILARTLENSINHISVYYRDLSNWGWLGINEKEVSPASLMKLPLMMAYLKKSETDPDLLKQKFVFHKNTLEWQFTQNIKPTKQLKDGDEYTIEEMITYMIKYSDNRASLELENLMPFADYNWVFEWIWISFPEIKNWSFDNNIKVKDYASFFRVLFNASYLNIENSKKALSLLSESSFNDWLRGWIPSNIAFSHKFGERWIIWTNWLEEKQLHDCGIVYYPNHPYIICVMTRWYDFTELIHALGDISSILYWAVEKSYLNNNE